MTVFQVLAIVFSVAVGVLTYRRKSITLSGFIALLLVCVVVVVLNEIPFLWLMFFMFASSSLLSKIEFVNSNKIKVKTGARDYKQAVANLGPAFLLVLGNHYFSSEIFVYAFIASVAGANADTWSSTIGSRSKNKPVSIITFQPIEKGVSGGISLVGTLGGVLGSLFIVVCSSFLPLLNEYDFSFLIVAFISGCVGFLFDSLIGDLFQGLYYSEDKNIYAENAQEGFRRIKGYSLIDNDLVNLLSVLFAALFCSLFLFMFTAS